MIAQGKFWMFSRQRERLGGKIILAGKLQVKLRVKKMKG